MKDRFKFRVWDKVRKTFKSHGDSAYSDYWICRCGSLFHENADDDLKTDLEFELDEKNYVIQQSTGLRDKNGKLIYEGDIAKTNNEYHTFIVKFGKYDTNGKNTANSENFGFYLKNISKKLEDSRDYNLYNIDGVCCYSPRYSANFKENVIEELGLEIIGNIYEDKKCLNQ